MDQITPEIAAKIVKQYVLPMFSKTQHKGKEGSVYADLKLTDKLAVHLEQEQKAHEELKETLEERDEQN